MRTWMVAGHGHDGTISQRGNKPKVCLCPFSPLQEWLGRQSSLRYTRNAKWVLSVAFTSESLIRAIWTSRNTTIQAASAWSSVSLFRVDGSRSPTVQLVPGLIRLVIRKQPQKPAVLHLYMEEHQYHSCIMWDFSGEAFKPTLWSFTRLSKEKAGGFLFVFFPRDTQIIFHTTEPEGS